MAQFEVYRDKDEQYRWRFKSGNGEVVAVSEAYTQKQSALNGIRSVKEDAPSAEIEDLT